MFFRKRKPDPQMTEDEFEDVIARLRAERREATPLELDQIKLRALNQAHRSASGPRARGVDVRRTFVVLVTTFSLMAGGTGAVIAGGDDNKSDGNNGNGNDKSKNKSQKKQSQNAGKSQYSQCKQSSQKANSHANKASSGSQQQQNCPPPPPKSNGSHGNGSHQSHQNHNSHGDDN